MKIRFYGHSDVGANRDNNEDSFLILSHVENSWVEINEGYIDISDSQGAVFVVADGMGGANAGEVASGLAIQTIKEELLKLKTLPVELGEISRLMTSFAMAGHRRIIKEANKDRAREGMGTTIVLGWILKDCLYVVWSGDSRCYIHKKTKGIGLLPYTDDHSLVWVQVKNHEITPEEARLSDESNLILQSLGGSIKKPEPEFKWTRLENKDRILFCSDGVNSMRIDGRV